MSKTTFIDGNAAQGITGTRLMAEFLNQVFTHRHDGQDDDGHAPLDYAAATGSGNAYAVALTPPLPALIPGLPITFLANHTNTGSATLDIDGLGAKTVRNVNQNLDAGQIQSGQLVTVMYDGAYFQMVSAMRVQDSLLPLFTSAGSILARGASGLEAIAAVAAGNYLKSAGVGVKPVMGKLSLEDTGVAVGYRGITTSSQTDIAITTGFRPSAMFFLAPVHTATWACLSVGVSNGSMNHCAFMVIGENHYEVDEGVASCFYIRNPAGDGMRSGAVISRSSTGFTVRQEPGGLLLSTNLIYCALP